MKRLTALTLGIFMLGAAGRAGENTATFTHNGATVLNLGGRHLVSNPRPDPNYRTALNGIPNMRGSPVRMGALPGFMQIWADTFTLGGTGDVPSFLQVDGLGNSYVNGTRITHSVLNYYARAVLGKFTPAGNALWLIATARDSIGSGSNQITTLPDNSVVWAWSGYYTIDSTHVERRSDSDGSLIWQTSIAGDAALGSYGNMVIAIQRNDTNGTVLLLDHGGSILRSFPTNCEVNGSVTIRVWNGMLYLFAGRRGGIATSLSAFVACYDIVSGSLLWRQDFFDVVRLFGDVDIDGCVYAGGSLWTYNFPQEGNLRFVLSKLSSDGILLWTTGWFPKPNPNGNLGNWINGVTVSHHSTPGQRIVVLLGTTQQDTVDNNFSAAYMEGRSAATGDSLLAVTWQYSTGVNSMNGGQFDQDNNLIILGQEFRYSADSVAGYGHIHKFAGAATSVKPIRSLIPTTFVLFQNYPNPFNPSTTIRYALPMRAQVRLTVYNVLGQIVVTPIQGEQQAGYHDLRFDGTNLASGVYFYRIQAGSFVQVKKLLLLR